MDKPAYVREMFSRIARRYDLMNWLMTLGRDQVWRRHAARAAQPPPRGMCLDLAIGTGDLALAVLDVAPRARIVGADFSVPMMRVAQAKMRTRGESRIVFTAGDALRLPFPDATFDCLVNGFLLRNLGDLQRAFAEMRRVLKPGGRAVCLEITQPRAPVFRQLFHMYFYRWVPFIGGMISRDGDAYAYLPDSLTHFIAPDVLRALMLSAGFGQVEYQLLGWGTIAVHVGVA